LDGTKDGFPLGSVLIDGLTLGRLEGDELFEGRMLGFALGWVLRVGLSDGETDG
jgi:hypothetical protein